MLRVYWVIKTLELQICPAYAVRVGKPCSVLLTKSKRVKVEGSPTYLDRPCDSCLAALAAEKRYRLKVIRNSASRVMTPWQWKMRRLASDKLKWVWRSFDWWRKLQQMAISEHKHIPRILNITIRCRMYHVRIGWKSEQPFLLVRAKLSSRSTCFR